MGLFDSVLAPFIPTRTSIPNPTNGAVHVPGFPSRNPTGDYKPPVQPDPSKPGTDYQPANSDKTSQIVNSVIMYGGLAIGAYVVYRIVKKNM